MPLASCRPNRPPTSADLLLKNQLGWLLLLRVIFLTLVLGISAVLQAKGLRLAEEKFLYPVLFISGVYLFTIGSALLLRTIACYRPFAVGQLTIDILLISCLVFFSGTSQSLFTVIYFLPIIAGGFMLFKRGGLLLAALSTISYGVLLALEYSRHTINILTIVRPVSLSIEGLLNLFAINGISFFFVAVISASVAERLYRTEAALAGATSRFDRLSLLYKQIFDDITTGIITVDGDHRITSCNRAAERITGYRAIELIGRRADQLFPDLRPADEQTWQAEAQLQRKDGVAIPVGYSWSRLHSPDLMENSRIITMQDLSRLREMEARVRQTEKMAAVGEMAAGIAHEFRNPLAAISGSAQLLAQRAAALEQQAIGAPAGQGKLLEIIIRECDRLEGAVRDFLLFSRPAAPARSQTAIRPIAEEAIEVIRQTPACAAEHRFVLEIGDEVEGWVDGAQLKQVLLNLFGNACQAMPAGGVITCAARQEGEAGAGKENGLWLQVRDNGPGITAENLQKIFNPYFTTRPDGTGLGLAIVHQIIASHDGAIKAESSPPGHGAAFTITLPPA